MNSTGLGSLSAGTSSNQIVLTSPKHTMTITQVIITLNQIISYPTNLQDFARAR